MANGQFISWEEFQKRTISKEPTGYYARVKKRDPIDYLYAARYETLGKVTQLVNEIRKYDGEPLFEVFDADSNYAPTIRVVQKGRKTPDWYRILLTLADLKPDEIIDTPDYLDCWWD